MALIGIQMRLWLLKILKNGDYRELSDIVCEGVYLVLR